MAIVQADGNTLPSWLITFYNFPNGDKAGHFLLMGFAAFLLNLVAKDRSIKLGSISISVIPVIFAVLVTIEEYSQQFFPNRTMSWEDLVVSYLGILVIGIVGSRAVLRLSTQKT